MCLAVPSRIVEIDNLLAVVDVYGARKEISLLLMPEETRIGDYVLVHAGVAIGKVDEKEAEETAALLQELMKEDYSEE
ncbi:MAG TPA: hypothetical protein DHW81_04810 [Nitrospiraceae bacterium]|nr:hypothetical protein [Nitrospiraceae bacterium]